MQETLLVIWAIGALFTIILNAASRQLRRWPDYAFVGVIAALWWAVVILLGAVVAYDWQDAKHRRGRIW